jgi:hypothetical protein
MSQTGSKLHGVLFKGIFDKKKTLSFWIISKGVVIFSSEVKGRKKLSGKKRICFKSTL